MRSLTLLAIILLIGLTAACSDEGGAEGATEYSVTVRFNEAVTQADQEEAAEILAVYDEDVDMLVQESFPPTGVATVKSTDPDVCLEIQADFEAKSYVESVGCLIHDPPPSDNEPDEPVSSTPEGDEGAPIY